MMNIEPTAMLTECTNRFLTSFSPKEVEVRHALGRFDDWLHTVKADSSISDNARIAVAEALNNVVEDSGAKASTKVSVYATYLEGNLEISVLDRGSPLPDWLVHLHCSDETKPGNPMRHADTSLDLTEGENELPEGGFGWGLIHALTSSRSYQRNGTENQLTLIIAR
jgi:serine/threonine-protein kinase RsbW